MAQASATDAAQYDENLPRPITDTMSSDPARDSVGDRKRKEQEEEHQKDLEHHHGHAGDVSPASRRRFELIRCTGVHGGYVCYQSWPEARAWSKHDRFECCECSC